MFQKLKVLFVVVFLKVKTTIQVCINLKFPNDLFRLMVVIIACFLQISWPLVVIQFLWAIYGKEEVFQTASQMFEFCALNYIGVAAKRGIYKLHCAYTI